MLNTKAIIFDLDGTLLDVREGFYWQFQELTKIYDGKPVSKELIDSAAHSTTEQLVRSLVLNTDVPLPDILAVHQHLRLESYNRFLQLYSGARDLLTQLTGRGIKLAALTAGNFLTVSCLDRTRIRGHFHTIVTADHVTRHKPHPEGLLLILSELEIAPSNAILVGDTVADIMAGKEARVKKSIGVLHGFGSRDDLQNAGADHLVSDLQSILRFID